MNKQLTAATLLALPLLSLTGPAFAFDLTPVDSPTPAPVEEVVKSKAQLKAEEKIAKTAEKASSAEVGSKAAEKAEEKIAKTQAKADAKDARA